MKHAGRATHAALRLIYWTLFVLLALMMAGVLARFLADVVFQVAGALVALWVFVLFCLYFFRDPNPDVPNTPGMILAAGHGKVDAIDEVDEPEFMGGRCRRISVFLSVFDIHVQNAPTAGRIVLARHTPGRFLNAMRADSAVYNENLFLGIESSEVPDRKVGVRLIAGVIARRIVPWVQTGDTVARGERISLIQFGSRVDVLLPLSARLLVEVGDTVCGGETLLAQWD